MIASLGDRDWFAELVAGSDPHRKLELVIELLRRPEGRGTLVDGFALAARPADRHTRGPYRGRPAVIGDRNVFVIGIERIAGTAPHAAVSCVLDAGEKIWEAADRRRQGQGTIRRVVQQPRGDRLYFCPVGAVRRQERGEAPAQ